MNQLIRYWNGYVRVRLRGNMPERFLNLCAANHIFLWNLFYDKDSYLLTMSVRDFRRLKPLGRKTGCRLHLVEKHGMPFFFYRNRKRKGFFIGVFLFGGLLSLLSCFIWNIHVEGNHANSTYTILAFLEQKGVHHGIWKNQIVCQDLSAQVREAFPNITWVSTKIQGTQLLVEVKENVDGYQEEKASEEDAPCDLIAAMDGTVEKIITRNGMPKVSEGAACAKGDLLVSGEIPIINDGGEVVRYKYVHADSDVYIRTRYYYYKEFKRKYTDRIYDAETSARPFFEVGQYRLDLGFEDQKGSSKIFYENRHQVFLTENFALPLYYGTVTSQNYHEEEKLYTEKKASEIANGQLEQYMDELKKKGVQIYENNVKIDVLDTACIAKGELVVLEQAVQEAPCEMKDVTPGKDSALDEQ